MVKKKSIGPHVISDRSNTQPADLTPDELRRVVGFIELLIEIDEETNYMKRCCDDACESK